MFLRQSRTQVERYGVLQGPYPSSDVIYDQVTSQSSLVGKLQTRRIETTWDGGINFD